MAITKHGHHIPHTPHMGADQNVSASPCGGIASCLACSREAADAIRSRPLDTCVIDIGLKNIVDQTTKKTLTGLISWCTTHNQRVEDLVDIELGHPVCKISYDARLAMAELNSGLVVVTDLFRQLGDLATQAAVIFNKIADIQERNEN